MLSLKGNDCPVFAAAGLLWRLFSALDGDVIELGNVTHRAAEGLRSTTAKQPAEARYEAAWLGIIQIAATSKLIATEPRIAIEMVQPSSAAWAISCSFMLSIPSRPSTTPFKCEDWMRIPSGPFSAVMVAVTLTRRAIPPRWAMTDRNPIA